MVKISSWGRLPYAESSPVYIYDREHIKTIIAAHRPGLPYGVGRSYGDVCLNPGGILWMMQGLDRFIRLDDTSGRLLCEAGVLLRDIQQVAIPRGWRLPVTPGTQFVTVGGAIANDVHGKNHHAQGCFGDHVRSLSLLRTDGTHIECGPDHNPQWFAATVGGIGLTGCILTAEIQLSRTPGPWLETESIPYGNLAEFFRLSDTSEADWEHTVSWIDCLSGGKGRGLFLRGNHTQIAGEPQFQKRALAIPVEPPVSLVNGVSLRLFNTAYYHLGKWRAGKRVQHYLPFFYPLDSIHEWNRIYGPKGFYQYQCVLPREYGEQGIAAMLDEIAKSGMGSFLAVLKTFGQRAPVGMLSFPQPGVTLALDFPNRGERTEKLFIRLDAIVAEAKGRLYLGKDARMSRQLFEAGYPRLQDFIAYRDPGISSSMSRRLMGV